MWTRAAVKERAKSALTGRYGQSLLPGLIYYAILYAASFAVSLVFMPVIMLLLFSLVSKLPLLLNSAAEPYFLYGYGYTYQITDWGAFFEGLAAIIVPFLILYAIVLALGMIVSIFVSNPMVVGVYSWFSRSRENRARAPSAGQTFFAFRARRYGKVVGGMAYMTLIVFLWSLLFVIPGIIASYRYRFVPWILADNPSIGYRRAMELSRQMTTGEKWNIFVFDLSFLGWILLGVFTCYIGLFFLFPYIWASNAELYADFRHRALMSGACTFAELGFAPPAQPQYY